MPYENEHAARLVAPEKFQANSFRRKNNAFGEGIDAIFGKLIGEDSLTLQAIRFDAQRYTAEQAKKWLKEHDYKPIEFEEASGKTMKRKVDIAVAQREFLVGKYDPNDPLPVRISDPVNPERVIRFRASDDTLDRMEEVIMADGWVFDNFKKNPVMMQFHDYCSWPIGKVVACGVIGNALFVDAEFDPPEVDENADLVFRKIVHGTIKTGSVGFIPLEFVRPGDGSTKAKAIVERYPKAKKIYTKQELLEWTICPIPANPNALAASVGMAMEESLEQTAQGESSEEDAVRKKLDRLLGKLQHE